MKPFPRQKGSALVIVLSCLVFISIMILAFFASVSNEHQTAVSYANSSSTRLLADSTVDIVIGQIKDATKGVDLTNNDTLAWASQPGMIRTYNQSGQPAGYYKLYSWSGMVGSGAFDPTASGEVPPSTWMNNPALYTDLNDPVSGIFPIVDPTALGKVQGFNIINAPKSTTNEAPMPVQWLYVLQDGKLAPATASSTGATVNVPLATASNPIVARIAFWADDDTSKVNLNTAAGDLWVTPTSTGPQASNTANGNPGSFWDTPRTQSTFERTYLAKRQPVKNEFQRFPGHPATTYLSAVFPELTTEDIYQIATRVTLGGSKGGTVVPTLGQPVVTDTDRLYTSVDELLFKAGTGDPRTKNPYKTSTLTPAMVEQGKFFLTAHSRAPEVNLFNQPRVVIWPVSADTGSSARTAYDSLIASCGTLNKKAYYFQRKDPNSQTVDLPDPGAAGSSPDGLGRNRYLISYLRKLTGEKIPGFSIGANDTFKKKYPLDRDQILTEIFDYVRALNSQDASVAGLTSYTITASKDSGGTGGAAGQGQIFPITDDSHADSNSEILRGFGRFATVREASLLFVGVGQTAGTRKSVPPSAGPIPPSQRPDLVIADGFTRVQAVFLLNFFDPSQGWAISVPDFHVKVSGLSGFQWNAQPMGFVDDGIVKVEKNFNTGTYGGYKGASSYVEPSSFNVISGYIDLPTTSDATPTTFDFKGNDIRVQIWDRTDKILIQTLTINFPNGKFPVPELAPRLVDGGDTTNNLLPLTKDFRLLTTYSGSVATKPAITGRFSGANANTAYTVSSKTWACGKDVIRSVQANTDYRLVAATQNPGSSFFSPSPGYDDQTVRLAHSIAEASTGRGWYPPKGASLAKLVPDADYGAPTVTTSDYVYGDYVDGPAGTDAQRLATPGSALGYIAPIAFAESGGKLVAANGVYAGTPKTGPSVSAYPPGDWDNGFSTVPDGPYINKADEGNIVNVTTQTPYYDNLNAYTTTGGTFFSPNRMMPSAVMFGSLPTGIKAKKPWQTLLFRPDPGGTPQHAGVATPKDHLLLDLFNMPIVEPYAISDPFSTAGKINMNYQIVPFTYLKRDTGLRAVLRSEQILALSNSDAPNYKNTSVSFTNQRKYLNLDQTLTGFENRFASGDIFRSATEICDIWLVPEGESYTAMQTYWSTHLLTGDNVRERPYANIYPRLTTKSNTFTVHYRVQTLKKVKGGTQTEWTDGRDQVTGEYRGSSVLERYLDTNDDRIPDYATAATSTVPPDPIDKFYKFRVIETRQFTP